MNVAKKREVAARIKRRLSELGQNQTWLASQLGLSKTIVGRYVDEIDPEVPVKGKPRFTQIADALGMTVDELWDGVEPPQSEDQGIDLYAEAMRIAKEETDAMDMTVTFEEWASLAKIAYKAALASPSKAVDRGVIREAIEYGRITKMHASLKHQH